MSPLLDGMSVGRRHSGVTRPPGSVVVSSAVDPVTVAAVIDYWDADDLGANGTAVASWVGRKNSRSLAQATGASQPLVAANALNGHKAISLDGVDDFLSYTTGTAFATTSALECYVVVRRAAGSSSGANPILLSVDAGANDWDNIASAEVITYANNNQEWYAFRNNVYGSTRSWLTTRDTYGVLHSWWDGTNHTMAEGSVVGTPVAQTGTFAATRIWVGSYQGASNFHTGNIAAIVLANGLTGAERAGIEAYLAARYAL
jgi:hypothetical protein